MPESDPKNFSTLETAAYLHRHLKPKAAEPPKLPASKKRFHEPLGEVDFANETGFAIRQGDISIASNWTSVYRSALTSRQKEYVLDDLYEHDEVLALQNFSLLNNSTGIKISESDLITSGTGVIFDPTSDYWKTAYHYTHDVIVLSGAPISPVVIASLFHEAGHPADFKKRPEILPTVEKVESLVWNPASKDLTIEELEFFLRYERIAWAFGLQKLKPFIGDDGPFPKSEVDDFVHNSSLQAKSEAIRRKFVNN